MVNLLKKTLAVIIIINLVLLGFLFREIKDMYAARHSYPSYLHTTIYIDPSFDEFEQQAIIAAALEWSETTNHIIDYDIVMLPTTEAIDIDNSLIISKVTLNEANILAMDDNGERLTLGYFNSKTIIPSILLVHDRIDNEDYQSVILHEIGHSLGMKHLTGEVGLDTLMYPLRWTKINNLLVKAGSDHLTLKDGEQFCKMYHCDAAKLKYKEKSLHP